jgi:hypothetical protein
MTVALLSFVITFLVVSNLWLLFFRPRRVVVIHAEPREKQTTGR